MEVPMVWLLLYEMDTVTPVKIMDEADGIFIALVLLGKVWIQLSSFSAEG